MEKVCKCGAEFNASKNIEYCPSCRFFRQHGQKDIWLEEHFDQPVEVAVFKYSGEDPLYEKTYKEELLDLIWEVVPQGDFRLRQSEIKSFRSALKGEDRMSQRFAKAWAFLSTPASMWEMRKQLRSGGVL
jgi:hypothetical protein